MRGYKHVQSHLADQFGSGASIRIGTFEYYREMPNERADPLEGIAEYVVDRLKPGHAHLPQYAKARSLVGLPSEGLLPSKRTNFFANRFVYKLPPAYIFCCSTRPDERLIAEGQAVFEINGLDLFAHRITKALNHVLIRAEVGLVKYENRSVNPFEGVILDHDPFKKSIMFSHENEIRIVWEAMQTEEKFITFSAPRVAPLLKRIA